MSSDVPNQDDSSLDDEEVIAFLKARPDFLRKHPELLEILSPPDVKHGGNVVDFQSFALNSLQQNMQDLKDEFSGLLDSARGNMSVQSQVHHAALHLLKARDLEHLLEVLTMDFLRYFDVDVVRLIIESEIAELYEVSYGEQSYSGINFVPLQTVDLCLGTDQFAALVPDTELDPPYGYEAIFADCDEMVKSCALLRLDLDRISKQGILAFGVRESGRFHSHLGVELLKFLADVVALRLNQCLTEHEIERLL